MSTLDQFIRFTTDSVGLERTLRFFQALLQIIPSYPLIFSLFLQLLSLASAGGGPASAPEEAVKTAAVLAGVKNKIILGRRLFRTFRFLECFVGAYRLYAAATSSPAPTATGAGGGGSTDNNADGDVKNRGKAGGGMSLETWLDIGARSFMGMYLLLELLTLPEGLGVEGLRVWSAEHEATLMLEAMRFWFFALACGALSGASKLVKVFAYAPVPEAGEGYGTGEKAAEEEKKEEKPDWEKERVRLRQLVRVRKEQRARWRRHVRTRSAGLVRKMVADVLDLTLPGASIGWIGASPGQVGLAMLGSTVLTSMDAWERCGREVRSA